MEQASPSWVKLKPAEVEALIVDLAKTNSPEKIGMILRDNHGIPKTKQVINKRISKVLREHNIDFRTEKQIITDCVENLKGHIAKNKKDHPAKRALTKKLWQIKE